jgi:MFS family permease
MSAGKSRLWTRNFVTCSVVNFLTAMCFYLLMIVVSGYSIGKFHSSPGGAGFSASIFVIGGLMARLFFGKWIGRLGYKQTLYSGTILSLVMTFLYFGINSFFSLLAIRFLHGVGFGITTTATGTIVSLIVPKERSGEGIGYYGLSQILATAVGPFVGMFLSKYGSYGMIFIVCTIITGISFLISLLLSMPKIKLTEEQLNEIKGFKLANFFESKVIPISIIGMLVYFSYSGVVSFLAVYSHEIHLENAAGYFFIIYAAIIVVSRPFIGRLFDLKGENIIMYPSIILFTLGMILFSQSHYGYVLLLAGGLIGFGVGAIQSSTQAISVKITPRHRMGLANSTYFALLDIGMGIGPLLVGLLIPITGYRGMYLFVAIAGGALSLLLYYLLHGKNIKKENKK